MNLGRSRLDRHFQLKKAQTRLSRRPLVHSRRKKASWTKGNDARHNLGNMQVIEMYKYCSAVQKIFKTLSRAQCGQIWPGIALLRTQLSTETVDSRLGARYETPPSCGQDWLPQFTQQRRQLGFPDFHRYWSDLLVTNHPGFIDHEGLGNAVDAQLDSDTAVEVR